MEPRLSVVTVSDYEPGETKTWGDELALLQALSLQDIDEPFELILVESRGSSSRPAPAILFETMPGLQVHYHDSTQSATLKDFGVSLSRGHYVAVLESDCIPSPDWLRLLVDALDRGGYDAVSGRTSYGEDSTYRRTMSLLHRSWDDPGDSGETRHISNNGAVYRRELLERFPYPEAVTPFLSAAMRNEQIRQAGYRFWFERQATMQHALGGMSFIWDYQRNKGHQSMGSNRRRNPALIPLRLAGKVATDCRNAARLGSRYLHWHDWLLLPWLMLAEIPPFLAGTVDAVRDVPGIPGSAYR